MCFLLNLVFSTVHNNQSGSSPVESASYHFVSRSLCCRHKRHIVIHSFECLMLFFLLAGQEINAELGSVSDSSDDDFVTSRIVRRRVFIQVSEGARVVEGSHSNNLTERVE